MVFKMQEMGIDCTGSHENSDLASTMYWIDYQMPFLSFFYDTFPTVDVSSAGEAVVPRWWWSRSASGSNLVGDRQVRGLRGGRKKR
jgi:hypothetical protein